MLEIPSPGGSATMINTASRKLNNGDTDVTTPAPEAGLVNGVQTVLEQHDTQQTFSGGDDLWTVLYESSKEGDVEMLRWSMLAPPNLRSAILADNKRLPFIDLGAPGFIQTNKGDEPGDITNSDQTRYERFGNAEGFEPLVIHQHHDGLPPTSPALIEEFRMYHNLWTADGTKFFKITAGGASEHAATVTSEQVLVSTRFLRQFQAAKQLDLVLRISSYQYVYDPDGDASFGEIVSINDDDSVSFKVEVVDLTHDRNRPCSVLDGTKVIAAPSQQNAGIWPFNYTATVQFVGSSWLSPTAGRAP